MHIHGCEFFCFRWRKVIQTADFFLKSFSLYYFYAVFCSRVFDCMFEFHYHIGMHVANTRTLFPHLFSFSRKLIKSTTAYYSAALSVLIHTFDIFIDTRYPYRAKVIYSYCCWCCHCCAIVVFILFLLFDLFSTDSSFIKSSLVKVLFSSLFFLGIPKSDIKEHVVCIRFSAKTMK